MNELRSALAKLQDEVSKLERVMSQFDEFSGQITELAEKAKHDPAARVQLESIHQEWNSIATQKGEQLKKNAIKIMQANATQEAEFTTQMGLSSSEPMPPPASPKKSKHKSRPLV